MSHPVILGHHLLLYNNFEMAVRWLASQAWSHGTDELTGIISTRGFYVWAETVWVGLLPQPEHFPLDLFYIVGFGDNSSFKIEPYWSKNICEPPLRAEI